MERVYWENWSNMKDLMKDFEIEIEEVEDIDEMLFAWYGYGDYEGSAFVLFRKGDKLYEVNGSHCSCYGLEDQWKPEETLKESLLLRYEKGSFYIYSNEIKEILGEVIHSL